MSLSTTGGTMLEFDLSGPYEDVRARVITGIISLYECTRHYGGPEEGGWWYDRHHFIAAVEPVIARPFGEAQDRVRFVNGHLADVADRDGGGPYVCVEPYPGEMDTSNRPRPHYE